MGLTGHSMRWFFLESQKNAYFFNFRSIFFTICEKLAIFKNKTGFDRKLKDTPLKIYSL